MKTLLRFSRAVDSINVHIGRVVAWGILAAILISAANATVRKVFNTSSNSWLEIQWILFGAVFLLCSAWTLLSNEHIRIDIVNGTLPKRVRDWIDIIGHLFFLIPTALVLTYLGWPFFWRSLLQNEQSTNAGGLPVYPSKLLIPLGLHASSRPGRVRADQAHRHPQRRYGGHRLRGRAPRGGRGRGPARHRGRTGRGREARARRAGKAIQSMIRHIANLAGRSP